MILPMTRDYAKQIAGWTYEGEYAFYNHTRDTDSIRHLMGGAYYAALGPDAELYGYYCFGDPSRIPTVEEHAYDLDALDIGLGMHPDRCGRGKGQEFVIAGLDFAEKQFGVHNFRLSVAAFNKRAMKVYEKIGFGISAQVTNSYFRNVFYIMTLDKSI